MNGSIQNITPSDALTCLERLTRIATVGIREGTCWAFEVTVRTGTPGTSTSRYIEANGDTIGEAIARAEDCVRLWWPPELIECLDRKPNPPLKGTITAFRAEQ